MLLASAVPVSVSDVIGDAVADRAAVGRETNNNRSRRPGHRRRTIRNFDDERMVSKVDLDLLDIVIGRNRRIAQKRIEDSSPSLPLGQS